MIWLAHDRFHPPHGRVDGVIYYGGSPVAQPIFIVGWDDGAVELVHWDALSSTWVSVSIQDAQLSVNVPIMIAGVLPAVDGSLLTNLTASHIATPGTLPALDASALINIPPPSVGFLGTAAAGTGALDGSGNFTPTVPVPISPAVGFVLTATWGDVGFMSGHVLEITSGGTIVSSDNGGTDSGKAINWQAVYI